MSVAADICWCRHVRQAHWDVGGCKNIRCGCQEYAPRAAFTVAPEPQQSIEERLAAEMWNEREVLDAGTKGYDRRRYRAAARRIAARLGAPRPEVGEG